VRSCGVSRVDDQAEHPVMDLDSATATLTIMRNEQLRVGSAVDS
jgi:hypothetical protein